MAPNEIHCSECRRKALKSRQSAPRENVCQRCWDDYDYKRALRKGLFGGRHMRRLMNDMARGKIPYRR